MPPAGPDAQFGLRIEAWDHASREPQVRVLLSVREGAAPLGGGGEGWQAHMRAVVHDRADALLAHRGKTNDHRARGLLAVEACELACPGLGIPHGLPVLRDHHPAENGPADSSHGPAGVEAHPLNEQSIKREVRVSEQLEQDHPAERRREPQRQTTHPVGGQPLVDRRRFRRR